ncbi:mechanosensitive ion channel family protein [Nocardioides coralli]|uniref:mechanosensitive ion channel family protein n=1 Tax=Nocardioides coralli TaxID=2872154 RepID=UPI001CA39DB3|nr:mechanosensitive ion channel family protein [Nocardioides coralli]QZY28302.1 mechanosensitive ion channel family protein [Nocardioides coralli]
MFDLEVSDPCTNDEIVCDYVHRVTGSDTAAFVADTIVGVPLALLGLLLLGLVIRWVLHRLVDRLVKRAEGGVLPERVGRMSLGSLGMKRASTPRDMAAATRRVQRAQTMGSLLKSIVTGVLVAVFGTMMLAEIGVNVGPIIASAGIVGIALGFGAQSLVSDFLSGIFMIFEDQYGVGDVVDLGEAIGTVEAVSLRVTRVRDVNGTVWYVRNGEIMRVGNMSQNWARTVLDVTVGYHEDLARVKRVLQEVAHDLWEDEEYKGLVIEEPEVWGVQDLAADGVAVRVTLKTAPLEQWAVAREMRQRIKARFDHEGIEIPFPQRVVWHRDTESAPGEPTDPTTADRA